MNLVVFSFAISVVALIFSGAAIYISHFWRGRLKSASPSSLFFAYDEAGSGVPCISVSVFLYTTGNSGRLVEQLYLSVSQKEKSQAFTSWHTGQSSHRMKISGLKIDRNGQSLNNLFYPPHGESSFKYTPGSLNLQLFARLAGSNKNVLLLNETLQLTENEVSAMNDGKVVVCDALSRTKEFHKYIDTFKKSEERKFLEGFSTMVDAIAAQEIK